MNISKKKAVKVNNILNKSIENNTLNKYTIVD